MLSVPMDDSGFFSTEGELHDQADAKWIVIRGLLWGHIQATILFKVGMGTDSGSKGEGWEPSFHQI
jgi:hypothetical protein